MASQSRALLACMLLSGLCVSALADERQAERQLIRQIQDQIIPQLLYSQSEMRRDFRREFHPEIKKGNERLRSLADHLHSDAMYWLDASNTYWLPQGTRLLLFWSDGFWTPQDGYARQRNFIAALNATGKEAELALLHRVDNVYHACSGQFCRWHSRCFWPLSPPQSSNPSSAVIRYMQLGASGSTYHYNIIAYNRYQRRLELRPLQLAADIDLRPHNLGEGGCR